MSFCQSIRSCYHAHTNPAAPRSNLHMRLRLSHTCVWSAALLSGSTPTGQWAKVANYKSEILLFTKLHGRFPGANADWLSFCQQLSFPLPFGQRFPWTQLRSVKSQQLQVYCIISFACGCRTCSAATLDHPPFSV